jgi:dihydroorotase
MLDLVLKNVILPDGTCRDIGIRDSLVKHIGAGGVAHETIDCTGYLCLPGAVDMHVHMRGGKERSKEDWTSGSKSALAGGVTLVVDQPNTLPPLITPDRFLERVAEATRESYCNFGINGAVQEGADVPGLWKAGAMALGEIFLAPSTHGSAVSLEMLKESITTLQEWQAPATIHAEGSPSHRPVSLADHDCSRSVQAEEEMVKKILKAIPHYRYLHFCHLSSPGAVDSVTTTCEMTPHHLLLSFENFSPHDTRGKVNPPLRSTAVRQALWSRWAHIDAIASDHAPHTITEKRVPFEQAPAGLPGVETMIPLLLISVLEKKITLTSLIEKTSLSPSRILGILPPGFFPGYRADFALFPREKTRITTEILHSRCGWTPYEGLDAVFPEVVIMEGRCVYQKGEFLERSGRWYRGRGYKQSDPI